ncbi:MAG: hypothetical protein GXY76_06475 [Chloroflexi bacterium]|nr:hypothetical protein [Chloroflexota bacterium]
MKAMRIAGRCLILAVALLGLVTCSSVAAQVTAPEGAAPEGAALVALAREDLAARLGVAPEGIALAGVSAAAFPCAPDGCPGHQPSQVIRLRAGGELYEYQAEAIGELLILWRELP